MAKHDDDRKHAPDEEDVAASDAADRDDAEGDVLHPNPPYTTTKHMTSPKFGSAGSGGAENEPGPERD